MLRVGGETEKEFAGAGHLDGDGAVGLRDEVGGGDVLPVEEIGGVLGRRGDPFGGDGGGFVLPGHYRLRAEEVYGGTGGGGFEDKLEDVF